MDQTAPLPLPLTDAEFAALLQSEGIAFPDLSESQTENSK